MADDDIKRLLEAMQQESAAEHAKTRRLFEESTIEMKRHFDVTAERLDRKIDAVVELVTIVDEKLDRRITDVEQRMERGFAETQAMIKFSHRELDRRMTALEDALSDLQARVERLEGSTH